MQGIFDRIRNFDSECTGFVGSKSSNYKAAEEMWEKSSAEDLVEIARNNANPAVRCYALEGILRDKNMSVKVADSLPELIDKLKGDQAECESMAGCCMMESTVADICTGLVNRYQNN